jgi:hypothetical protein
MMVAVWVAVAQLLSCSVAQLLSCCLNMTGGGANVNGNIGVQDQNSPESGVYSFCACGCACFLCLPPVCTLISARSGLKEWLYAKGLDELHDSLAVAFPSVASLATGFRGLSAVQIRGELGLMGLPGLGVATKLREALDAQAADSSSGI